MKVKGWQTAVIVLGLLIGGVSIAISAFRGGEVRLEHRYYLIDVESGQIFEVNSKKFRLVLPAHHPDSGKISLVRVRKGDDGKWTVDSRDRRTLGDLEKGVQNKAVDPVTGDLLLEPTKAQPYHLWPGAPGTES